MQKWDAPYRQCANGKDTEAAIAPPHLWEAVKRAIAFPLPNYSLPSRKPARRSMLLPRESLDLSYNSENMS
ncbi:hypothetical protein [Allocoleopsis franciscana]|uniref:hypothetical protein n=1 Tax=Allocoleopsis franciscana TaxID=2886352 RepID=UPI0003177372|nr:hypothetical protein [Allocoleopsis franciscana]